MADGAGPMGSTPGSKDESSLDCTISLPRAALRCDCLMHYHPTIDNLFDANVCNL